MIKGELNQEGQQNRQNSRKQLSRAYLSEKTALKARIRKAGKTWEETEDLIHNVYTETRDRLHSMAQIINLPAWLNCLVNPAADRFLPQ